MNYEIVEMEEKTIAGVSAVTGNQKPDMGAVIGQLWNDFYQGGVCEKLKDRVNAYAIGLYSDYAGDEYRVTVGAQVAESAVTAEQSREAVNGDQNSSESDSRLTIKVIPAGKYAKFSIYGDMVTAVAEAWGEIWKMNLNRSYTGDYEEYKTCDGRNAEIDIYIALQE